MELQNLRGFLAVAKFGSFTEAAQKTHRTQPTVSLQVKALEDELSVSLFERLGPKNTKLTAEGKLLVELCSPLVEQFDSIGSRFKEARNIYHQSIVKVVTHRAIMVSVLPEVIKRFRKEYPDVQLSILNRSRQEMSSLLYDAEVDLAITSFDKVPQHIEYKSLAKYNRILIGSKGHPLAKTKSISLEDISEYPLILPHPGSNTRRAIDAEFDKLGLQYKLAMEVVGRDAIKTYVGMDLGISILNEYYVSEEEKRLLFVKDLSKYLGKAETGIAVRKGRTLSPPISVFKTLCIDALS